jgi:caa(3)-type oxidase subunit IV
VVSLHSAHADVVSKKHKTHDRAYVGVFVALALFTAIELAIPTFFPGSRALLILLLVSVAIVKACCVASFYMHLKYEKGLLVGLAAAPLILCVILVLLVMGDVTAVNQGGWTMSVGAAQSSGIHP